MHRPSPSRRELVQGVLAAGGLSWAGRFEDDPSAALPAQSVVLFEGDSITEANRARRVGRPNLARGLGTGYAFMASAGLLATRPYDGIRCYNRGVRGSLLENLASRWQKSLDLRPDLLSILVGVNDVGQRLTETHQGTLEGYEAAYDELLARTREELPDVGLVIGEPFVLRTGVVEERWFPLFDTYRAATQRVAHSAGAIWVPYQSLFDEAVQHAPPEHWVEDGVHPTMAGHALMAAAWRSALG